MADKHEIALFGIKELNNECTVEKAGDILYNIATKEGVNGETVNKIIEKIEEKGEGPGRAIMAILWCADNDKMKKAGVPYTNSSYGDNGKFQRTVNNALTGESDTGSGILIDNVKKRLPDSPDNFKKWTLEDLYNYIKSDKFAAHRKDDFPQFFVDRPTIQVPQSIIYASMKGNEEDMESEASKRIQEYGVRQIIFTGAPGTGKTFTATKIADKLGTELNGNGKYRLVQFHPSYDYTDFVEGLRPIERANGMQFVKMDGSFKAFCRDVAEANCRANGVTLSDQDLNDPEKRKLYVNDPDPEKRYFFIVDEINRADLSKVFGELMFCLERDKRGEIVHTQYENLETYKPDSDPNGVDIFKNGFFIPENVVLIGTMNDIDRSVESMDFALRRRFEWMEFKVDEVLQSGFIGMGYPPETVKKLTERVKALNKIIESKGDLGLNRQYDISHGQFANLDIKNNEVDIEYIWKSRLESLLREYVRGNDEDAIKKFIDACENAFKNPPAPNGNTEQDNAAAYGQTEGQSNE